MDPTKIGVTASRLLAAIAAAEDNGDPANLRDLLGMPMSNVAPADVPEVERMRQYGLVDAHYGYTCGGTLGVWRLTPTGRTVLGERPPLHKPTFRHGFSADHHAELNCPRCGAASVYVRAADYYTDGYEYESFCDACDTSLRVTAVVAVDFSEPEISDADQ